MSGPLSMPADEFALVRRVAEQIGLDPAVPMTPVLHEAWHAAMFPRHAYLLHYIGARRLLAEIKENGLGDDSLRGLMTRAGLIVLTI